VYDFHDFHIVYIIVNNVARLLLQLKYWNVAAVMHYISACPAEHWTTFSCCL